MGCYAMLTGKCLHTIQRNTVPPSSGSRNPVPLLCLTLTMEVLNPSKTLLTIYQSTCHNIQEDLILHQHVTTLILTCCFLTFLFNSDQLNYLLIKNVKWPGDCKLDAVQDMTAYIKILIQYSVRQIQQKPKIGLRIACL
jgi:hypothetical protein